MQHGGCLLNSAQHVACLYLVAGFGSRGELPLFRVVERGNVDTALEVCARDLHYLVQRALDSVINSADKSGAELNGQRSAGALYGFAGAETRGLLIYLNRSAVAVHLDDLTDKTLAAYAHNVKHIRVAHTLGNNKRTGDLSYNSCFQFIHLNY